jgi:hypothetical protein
MAKSKNQPSIDSKTDENNNKQEVSSESHLKQDFEREESRLSVGDMDDTNPKGEDADNSISNRRPKGMDA